MELRPYQRDVIAKLSAAVAAGKRRVIIVAPTGAGKTIIGTAVIEQAIADANRERPNDDDTCNSLPCSCVSTTVGHVEGLGKTDRSSGTTAPACRASLAGVAFVMRA